MGVFLEDDGLEERPLLREVLVGADLVPMISLLTDCCGMLNENARIQFDAFDGHHEIASTAHAEDRRSPPCFSHSKLGVVLK